MKLFDIINKQDQVIGTATAQECHANPELIHRVVHFTLIDTVTNKILITQRSAEVKFDSGLWCFMGEHVLSDESYEDTVWKGLKNELGISQANDIHIKELGYHIFSYDTQTEFVRFFVGYCNSPQIKPDLKEIANYQWLSLEELLKNKHIYSEMTQYWLEHCLKAYTSVGNFSMLRD